MSRPPLALRSAVLGHRSAGRPGTLPVLWRFSRPHTLIGTTLSILGIYAIAVSELAGGDLAADPLDLVWTLLAGAGVNVYIVGINQITDVEIDRVNKPELPIAAGDLTVEAAQRIVAACAVVPLVLALTQGAVELVAVALGLAIGTAYSCPPLRIKRYPALASLSITFVRTLVVNLGVWLHFAAALAPAGSSPPVSPAVWALTAVTLPFSLAIAILKDVPDIEGDRRYGIATFSVRLGPRPVLGVAFGALMAAELGMAFAGAALLDDASAPLMVGAHLGAAALLWRWASGVDPRDRDGVTRFYQAVWRLFFLEYLIVPAAFIAG